LKRIEKYDVSEMSFVSVFRWKGYESIAAVLGLLMQLISYLGFIEAISKMMCLVCKMNKDDRQVQGYSPQHRIITLSHNFEVGFEILTEVTMKSTVFWFIMACSWERFKETYHLCLHLSSPPAFGFFLGLPFIPVVGGDLLL
jgi:hypothetical protein